MKYTTAIFDLDGTLLNTLGDLADAVNAAIVPRGLAPATTEQVRQRVGDGIRNLILRSMPEGTPDAEIDACLAAFREHYNANLMNRTVPYEGIPDVLRAFKDAGMRIAVLSNKYDPASKALVAHFFPGLADLTLGERPGVPRKPDPASCREAMETLGARARANHLHWRQRRGYEYGQKRGCRLYRCDMGLSQPRSTGQSGRIPAGRYAV